ncbi:aldo-keto reductase [Artomyces pyxidatus]|uniref:Aldo-keto reductase n=1 Tax=Artomyces pyxidatus TaxID=48021 RepID=A0ACB8STV6_9AGAM|nr:aldo-keto reductase [Artomyces pyxidatus]
MAAITLQTKYKLRDGNEIPVLGFGTYELDGKEAYQAVTWALQAGYRHIDSAEWYENEHECGRAILDFCYSTNTPRSEVFFTTKLKNNDGYEATLNAIQRSLRECGLGYIDLYLIHGPWGGQTARREAWQAIVEAQAQGKLKSIGISTFGMRHIQELIDTGLPLPSVHQIDLHPFMTRTAIVNVCLPSRDVGPQAWAAVARGLRFDHPAIVALAKKYNKEPAHILLRYSLQKRFIPLVKSAVQSRIIDNTQIFDFELSGDDVAALDSLDEYLVTDWDPTDCP